MPEELIAELQRLIPRMMVVLGDVKGAAYKLRGSQYMGVELADSYMDACNSAQQALQWLTLPETREVIKQHKPKFEPGKSYYREMSYTDDDKE